MILYGLISGDYRETGGNRGTHCPRLDGGRLSRVDARTACYTGAADVCIALERKESEITTGTRRDSRSLEGCRVPGSLLSGVFPPWNASLFS